MECTGKKCSLGFGEVKRCTVHNCEDRTKPKTNFDRITASVESLAHFLYVLSDGCGLRCETCPLEETDDCGNKEKIKEWLQKECEG